MPPLLEKMFSVREVPWHGMGEILDEYPGRDEAMRLAGHTWKIIERPVFVGLDITNGVPAQYAISGRKDTAFEDRIYSPGDLVGWKALVREDNKKVLSIMRDSYVPIQWDTMWDVADAVANQPNVRYETGGLLKGGRIGWVLFWLDEPSTIPGDSSPIYPFGMVSSTHDGSGAMNAASGDFRVVCCNTYNAFRRGAEAAGTSYSFRHRGDPLERVEEAREVLKGIRKSHDSFIEMSTELVGMPVTDEGVRRFVQLFVPEPAKPTDRMIRNLEQRRLAVNNILTGPTCEGITNTAYGLVQAAGEFLDHYRPYRSGETYFARTCLKAEPLKFEAISLAREIAKDYAPVG